MTTESLIHIAQGDWSTLGEAASAIRERVFIKEQKVPLEEEWDGRDPDCLHFLAYCGGHPVGTARLLPDGHIGRVAVLEEARGQGLGLELMKAAIEAARLSGHREIMLDAQIHALSFYEQLGFQAFGEAFLDAGIPHRSMQLSLSD